MTSLETLPIASPFPVITIEDIGPVLNVCPISGIPENIVMSLQYCPAGRVVELSSLREYFCRAWGDTIENIARTIFLDFGREVTPEWWTVELKMVESRLTPWSVRFDSWAVDV